LSCDILFTSVPYTVTKIAPAAPAILIGMLEYHGYTGKFYDFNVLTLEDPDVKNFALGKNPSNTEYLDKVYRYHVNKMLEYKPNYIGISLFTYQCIRTAQLLCIYIRTIAPEVKIILGGPGLSHNGLHGVNIGAEWQELQLCDYWVKSEGENPIIEILKGDYISTPKWKQITDLDEFPIPVYDSYNWSLYKKHIPITGSRGCVRQCTFCDIHTHWKKFVWRSGKSIADEMIAQSIQHGIYNFAFTDSLINGSMKAYKELCTVLAEYNNKNPQNMLTWRGQFIFRPKNQMPEDIWKLSKEAGLTQIHIGIESLDEGVRDHMRKKFSNDDIIYGVQAMEKYGIEGVFLMIVGYVTDTEETLKNQKEMFKVLSPYAGDPIVKVAIGSTLAILPGTPLADMAVDLGITLGKDENDWVGLSNQTTRLQWRKDLIEHCVNLGYNVPEHVGHDQLMTSGSVINA
tara:strand:- start:471 stop:1841 length:1371 start_codon:yes stop_codon:yes gene_type:complete